MTWWLRWIHTHLMSLSPYLLLILCYKRHKRRWYRELEMRDWDHQYCITYFFFFFLLLLLSSSSPMEFDSNSTHVGPALQPFPMSTNYFKSEFDDVFHTDSKGYNFQDLHPFDHHFSSSSTSPLVGPSPISFYPDLAIQMNGFDPFDPFSNDNSPSHHQNLNLFKPSQENSEIAHNNNNGGAVGGYLSYPNPKILSFHHDLKPTNVVVPDESSCVSANPGFRKETGGRKRSNRAHQTTDNNNSNGASASMKKHSKGRKKTKSSKGQWTVEEDR